MGVINRLSELLANQIAAGEVVQSPSSLIKELVENSVDAQSSSIIVSVKEGGKKSIQVVDDGIGMSPEDALMAFERHATSKIGNVDDLFNISTFGFRGEALASIAAVAEVEMKTKQESDELGTLVRINGGVIVNNEPTVASSLHGTHIVVNNLFYNIPARKKSLKTDATENRRITAQFIRVALAHPTIAFSLYIDDKLIYMLNSAVNVRQRIKYVLGKNIGSSLIDLYVNTSLIEVKGYIGKPELAKKRSEGYFFVNGRYFESPYFLKAVQNGYDKLLPEGHNIPYFIYLQINPENVDVNITPTKTSVRFDDESAIWQIINAVVRESLGKNGIVPMIDFTASREVIDMPTFSPSSMVASDSFTSSSFRDSISSTFNSSENSTLNSSIGIELNELPRYNSFDENFSFSTAIEGQTESFRNVIVDDYTPQPQIERGDSVFEDSEVEILSNAFTASSSVIYEDIDSIEVTNIPSLEPIFVEEDIEVESRYNDIETESKTAEEQPKLFDARIEVKDCFVLDDNYGVASINGDLYIFDLRRAQLAYNYDKFQKQIENREQPRSQKLLFPVEISLSAADKLLLEQCSDSLQQLGFIFGDCGGINLEVEAVPYDISPSDTEWFIEDILSALKFSDLTIYKLTLKEQIAASLAKTSSRARAERITTEECKYLIEQLFLCKNYSFTHDGKRVFTHFTSQFIKGHF